MYKWGGQSRCLTRPLILSLRGVVRECLLSCCVVTAKWVVSCTRITCIQPLSRGSLTLLACSFFSESVVVFSLFYHSFSLCVLSFLSLVYWPFCTHLLACLIRQPFCISLKNQCFSVFGIMLCACCLSASSLEIRTRFFCKSVTLWTALQIPLWSKPRLVFRHKVDKITFREVLATQMGVTEAQHKSQLVWIVQIWPIFASQRVDFAGIRA